jgi:hypothetical protein
MAQFFFDVREGAEFRRDLIGDELLDLDAAEREGASLAALLARDRLPNPETRQVAVEVRDANGVLLTITVTLTIERPPFLTTNT